MYLLPNIPWAEHFSPQTPPVPNTHLPLTSTALHHTRDRDAFPRERQETSQPNQLAKVFLLFKLTLPADANISLGGLTSDAFEVRSGVKQGIVLAPILGISRDLLGHSSTTIHSST